MRFPEPASPGPAPHPRAVQAADAAVPDGRRGHLHLPATARVCAGASSAPTRSTSSLPERERGMLPADILKRAMAPLIELVDAARRLGELVETYDGYSLLGFLIERGVSEPALALMGPLLNLEGRFHFSLVEWFAHYHEDVFGDLEYIVDGADSCRTPSRRCSSTTPGWARRSTRSSRAPTASPSATATGSGRQGRSTADECIVTVPFVLLRHMEIERAGHRQGVHPAQRLLRPGTQDLHAVQPPVVGGGRRDHPWRHRHRPRHPQRRLHAGRPGPGHRARACSSRRTPGSRTAWRTACSPRTQRIARRCRTCARSTRRRPSTFEFGVSHDWALDPYAGGIGPLFRPHEMTEPVLRRRRPAGGPALVRERRVRPARPPLDRGRDRAGGQERVRDQRGDAQRAAGRVGGVTPGGRRWRPSGRAARRPPAGGGAWPAGMPGRRVAHRPGDAAGGRRAHALVRGRAAGRQRLDSEADSVVVGRRVTRCPRRFREFWVPQALIPAHRGWKRVLDAPLERMTLEIGSSTPRPAGAA